MPSTVMNGSATARPWRMIVAALLVCAATLVLVRAALPPFWGVPNLAIKWNAIQRQTPDRLVIGSSRIYRQIIPSIVDSAIGHGHTFNAGYAATFPPASYAFCERVLRDDHQPPKEIVVELSSYMLYEEANLEDHRYWYFLDVGEGVSLIRHALRLPNMERTERLGYAMRAAKATGFSFLELGLADDLLAARADEDTLRALGPLGDGVLTLETSARIFPGDTGVLGRRSRFLADTLVAQRRAIGLRHLYERGSDGQVSRVHLDRSIALIEKARMRGSRLRFVIPPLWVDQGEDLIALAHALPDSAVIDLCHPDRFPEFYRPENMFDGGHLNDKGARAFSLAFARAFSENNPR